MIKRKELTAYANSIMEQSMKIDGFFTNEHNTLFAIKSLCDCTVAIENGKKANIKSFELINNTIEQHYDYNFEVFMKDSLEYHLAMAYIDLIEYCRMNGFKPNFERCKTIDFVKYNYYDCLTIIISEHQFEEHPKMEKIVNQMLFLIELVCHQWKINLHSMVDYTVKYLLVGNKYKTFEL